MSFPTSPISFPTHVAQEVVAAAHLNAYANEIKVVEAGWLTTYGQTTAPWRVRGVNPCLEFGDGNQAGGGSTLGYFPGNGMNYIGLQCEPGTTGDTIKTRGIQGVLLAGAPANGGFRVHTVQGATGDNLNITNLMQATSFGCVTFMGAPVCRLHNSVAQNTATGALSLMSFDTEDADAYGMHAPGGSTITIGTGMAGWYVVTVGPAKWIPAGNYGDASRILYLYLNGAPICTVQSKGCGPSISTTLTLMHIVQLAVGDVLDVRTKQTSGAFVPVGNTIREEMLQFNVVKVA